MKARFIRHVGSRAALRALWGSESSTPEHLDPCPASHEGKGSHAGERSLVDEDLGAPERHFPDEELAALPINCESCGAAAPAHASRNVVRRRRYDTASGQPEPGDLYVVDCWQRYGPGQTCAYWDNCSGQHLYAVLPNGHTWDVDSRASNCTMEGERTHRCWVRQGEPPDVHVDKAGHTCAAGAGSISVPGYHGFLHHGAFTSC